MIFLIKVNRNSIIAPQILTAPNSAGKKETKSIISYYANPVRSARKTQPKFKAYKDDSIKEAFNNLFHNKCAYCESNYAKVQPVDVEHYRPKAGVVIDGILKEPGYYWLAADWDNLLPSCIDCNRQRTQHIIGEKKRTLGKANQFPIANENMRASGPGYEGYEIRLLLDPCRDDPDEHIVFSEDGNIKALSFMGMVSIEVYGLRRKNLCEAREACAKEIRGQIARIKWHIGMIQDENTSPASIVSIATQLREEIKILEGFMDETREYAGMARQIIMPYLEELRTVFPI